MFLRIPKKFRLPRLCLHLIPMKFAFCVHSPRKRQSKVESLRFYSRHLWSCTMLSKMVRMRVRVINQSNKSAGYENQVYTVSGRPYQSTYTPLLPPALLSSMMFIKNGEGEVEGDQPSKEKCRVRKSSLHSLGLSIKEYVHSTFTPGTVVQYDVIKHGEGQGEGDQPIKQKCQVRE